MSPVMNGSMTIVALTRGLLDHVADRERDPIARALAAGAAVRAARLVPDLSYAAVRADGEPIAAFGARPVWGRRGEGWALVSAQARPREMVAATRWAGDWTDALLAHGVFDRFDIYLPSDAPWRESFARGHHVRLVAGPMPAWDAAGRAFHHYGVWRE